MDDIDSDCSSTAADQYERYLVSCREVGQQCFDWWIAPLLRWALMLVQYLLENTKPTSEDFGQDSDH